MARTKTSDRLTRRVEEAFRLATGAAGKHGSRAWIAELARLDRRSVTRILRGDLRPDRIEAVLDAIEVGRRTALNDREGGV